jgi:hypothetical protein
MRRNEETANVTWYYSPESAVVYSVYMLTFNYPNIKIYYCSTGRLYTVWQSLSS